MSGKEIRRWADTQQFIQAPIPQTETGLPTVRILNATPDPLGTLAAITALYKGRVVRDLAELTHEERRQAYADMGATALNSALESINLVVLFEGVNRAFTHQHVRGRHAMYVQESLRFAVPEDWAAGIPLPPSLAADPDGPKARIWRKTLNAIEDSYSALVHNGMPAEEARDLLPHAIRTRIHWVVSWRELLHVAGLRTCTQAQFIWRIVFSEVAKALREWGARQPAWQAERLDGGGLVGVSDNWQWEFLAQQIRPVCYQTGQCAFKASFDRECTIRERVDVNAHAGRPSSEWGTEADLGLPTWNGPMHKWVRRSDGHGIIPAIEDWEWAADPAAARKGAK